MDGNIRQGKIGAAIADGIGVLLDATAVATPFVPGGVSAAISAARAVDRVDDLVDAGKRIKNADAIAEGKAFGKEMLQQTKESGYDVAGEVRLVPQNGKGNVNGNRTTVDQLIDNRDGTYTTLETKLRKTTPLSPGQKVANKHVNYGNKLFEVRSDVKNPGLRKNDVIEVIQYVRINKYE